MPTDNGDRVKADKLIAGWLGQIGIETSPTPVTVAKITDIWYAQRLRHLLWGWGPDPDPDFILSTYTTDQCRSWSDTCWSNEEYDQLYEDQQTAVQRGATGSHAIQQMQQIFYEEIPQIVLWYDNDLQAYRQRQVDGLRPLTDAFDADGRGGSFLFQYTPYSYLTIKPGERRGREPWEGAVASPRSSGSGSPPRCSAIGGVLVVARSRRNDEDEA